MRYNFKEIGERLKEERKATGIKSQDALAEYIAKHNYRNFKRQTIAKWEKGEECPPLDVLLTLCELYHCELGYLLCEYDCRTKENTDIQKVTGLSEKAIKKLKYYNQQMRECTEAINILLLSTNFENVLFQIKKYMNAVKLTDGLMKIRRKRRNEVFSKEPDCANGAYNWSYCDNLDEAWTKSTEKEALLEYHLDTDFKFLIKELSRLAGRKI